MRAVFMWMRRSLYGRIAVLSWNTKKKGVMRREGSL
jgi:hypothetical protein